MDACIYIYMVQERIYIAGWLGLVWRKQRKLSWLVGRIKGIYASKSALWQCAPCGLWALYIMQMSEVEGEGGETVTCMYVCNVT